MMRVLLTCGGTAGHINPALAIAETVKRNDPSAEIAFVGVRGGKEAELVPREGYPLCFVRSRGFRRSLSPTDIPANLQAAYLALTSPYLKETTDILKSFRPDVVIGTGGYACWPIMAAAARMKIPCALHESNALPGLAVRRLQRKVDRIWINFSHTADLLNRKEGVVRLGNPLREGFGSISREEARRRLGISSKQRMLLSFGGSLGAEKVNEAVIALMKELSPDHPELLHVHATGKRDHVTFMECFKRVGLDGSPNCIPKEYIYDMPLQMAAADLIISRAGAMTLSELALMKKPSILIPSPHVTDNHQYENAKVLSDAGAATLVQEKDLNGGALSHAVKELLFSQNALDAMSERVSQFADAKANEKIWKEILELIG